MMKLNRTKLLVAISAGILFSSLSMAKNSVDPTVAKLTEIGREAGRNALSGARSTAPADSFDEAASQAISALEEQGARTEFDKEDQELSKKIKRWTDGSKTLSKVDEGLTALTQKRAKDRRNKLAQGKTSVQKTLSNLGTGMLSNLFNTPSDATKSCIKGASPTTIKQQGEAVSGILKDVGGGFVKAMGDEFKKAEKAGLKELDKVLDAKDKELAAKEDPEAAKLVAEKLPKDASELEREVRLKKKKALATVSKESWERKLFNIFKAHREDLNKNKIGRDMFGEIGSSVQKQLEAGRVNLEQSVAGLFGRLAKNCQAVSEQAGVYGENSQQQQQNQMGGMFGGMQQMLGAAGGMFNQQFPPGSSAAQALNMLTANYRGSLNFIPVVTMYGQLFGNMLNQEQCTDYTPQAMEIVGTNLKNSFADLAKAQDPETLNAALKKADAAITTAVNDVGKLYNDPSNPDSGALASCEAFANIDRQLKQFAQAQGQQVMMKGQGGQSRGGVNPAANHFGQTF